MTFKTTLIRTVAAAAFLVAPQAVAQDTDWDAVEVRMEQVRGGVYVIFGRGGNIGVSVGEDGVYLVDDQYAPLTEKIKAAIAEVSDAPIRFAINTHYHGDHTGGNENLASEGTVIIAHDNVRQRMAAGTFIKAFNSETPAKTGGALPVVTFNHEAGLHLNGEQARMHHVARAHTDGDTIVHFEGTNVIHMGDTFFLGRFPFIDVENGGTIGGVIEAAGTALALADDETRIIPGHGPVTDKAGLMAYRDMLTIVRDRVSAMKADGLSLEDVQAADPLAGFKEGRPTGGERWHNLFIGFVYQSL